MVAWGDERKPALPEGPWPGRLPPPSPALVAQQAQPVEVISEAGEQVRVDARLALNADPGFVVMGRSKVEIVAWSGPWPVDERWWVTTERPHRLVRLQVLLANGQAVLLILSGGEWSIPAEFD